jgi:hypothetical protein
MKHLSTLLFLLLLSAAKNYAQPTITNYQMGGINSAAFTTNNFKCIWVGKGNRIWAGTQYGGLYTYDDNGLNVWLKSDKLTNVFINDIKSDADSGIWIAQSGTASVGGNSNIAGGINYFSVASDISMNFYSVSGTTTSADLLSRNVRSLYIDQSWGSANNRLPRVWAAQGTYITSFNTRKGGLSIGLNPFSTYFNNYTGGYATGTNATPISEAVGGNSEEVWIAARQNNGGSQILRYKPSGLYIGTHSNSDAPLLQSGFTAQAIHFDKAGNRWIGMKAGGLVIKTPNGWQSMNTASLFPTGSQVNFNAITSDEFGNVYIGTSTGLLEYQSKDYNPSSSPDYSPSYIQYTTNDGLPSNNITGLAWDQKYGRLLITSDAGVTFMNKRETYIKGVVQDVFANLDDTARKYSGLQKKPLRGVTTVRLLKNNVEEEFVFPDANGVFELREANDEDVYSVEVKSVIEGRTIKYLYNNVRNHTRLLPSLVPDALIEELKAFKPKMEKRCFPLKLFMGLETTNIFCTDALLTGNAFDTRNFETAQQEFYRTEGLTDFTKRTDNLATYYATLGTVYTLGGNATDFATDAVSNIFEAVDALKGFVDFGDALKKPANAPSLETVDEEIKQGTVDAIKMFKDAIILGLSKLSTYVKPDQKKFFDLCVSAVSEVADLLVEAFENGRESAKAKILVDNLKKIIAQAIAVGFYKNDYAQDYHQLFVPSASLSARNMESPNTYSLNFDNLYNPATTSIVKEAQDKYDGRKANITLLTDIAKVAGVASSAADAASALALVGGPASAGAVKVFSFAAKAVKVLAYAGCIYQANEGVYEIMDLSGNIQTRAGFFRPQPNNGYTTLNTAQVNTDSLVARKNRYNQRLTELQAIYTAPVYDVTAYKNKRKQLVQEDSLYNVELLTTLYGLYSSTDTAIVRIPGFTNRLDRVIDSFVSLQYALRHSLYYQNIAYILATDKTAYAPGLDSLCNQTKLANDSAVNGITYLINDINNNSILSKAYLVQEKYQINFSRVPGASGTVTYTFKNYGGETQNNVSFKISRPDAGYTITSPDSVNVGTILPGQSKSVTYNFQSPANDSVGNYRIDVKANNGIYKPVSGVLYAIDPTKFYSIKDGNWSDPATWSTNTVPVNTSKIYISHTVTVTANASCKSVNVYKPGNVIVNAGNRIIVNN